MDFGIQVGLKNQFKINSEFYLIINAKRNGAVDHPERVLGASYDVLEAAASREKTRRESNAPLRRLKDASSRSKASQHGPRRLQDAPRRAQDTSKTRSWWILGAKMEPSWHQNHIWKRSHVKIAWKLKNTILPHRIQWFFKIRGSIFEGKIMQKSIEKWDPR